MATCRRGHRALGHRADAGRSRYARSRYARTGLAALVLVAVVAACSAPAHPPAGHPLPPGPARPARFHPYPGQSWQWQLTGALDLDVPADVFDVDGARTSPAQVAALHRLGRWVVCYVDVGTWESFRPDAAAFPVAVRGAVVRGFPDERWLDIRHPARFTAALLRRIDDCAAKGFDAVEPDNVDAYQNASGFPLTAADQLSFNRWVAAAIHARGLLAGLKNDLDQVEQLEAAFDFAVDEECVRYEECDRLTPFLAAGKAVYEAEYGTPLSRICPQARRLRLSSVLKRPVLDAWRRACPAA